MNINQFVLFTTILIITSLQIVAQSFDLLCNNTDPKITGWKISDGVTTMKYYTDINDEVTCEPTIVDSGVEANIQSVYYNADYIWVEATGCPDYMTGPYNGDGNPSFPDDQSRTIVLPRNPVANPGGQINDHTFLGPIGFLLNGVAIFGSGDGMSYNNQGNWWRNAGVAENEGFGCDRSHPAMSDLHHHQNPIPFNYNETTAQSDVCTCFPSDAFYSPDPAKHSPLIGFAIDGYPIYGPYAYANTDGTGDIINMTTSYQLRNLSTRTTYADGTTAPNPGPDVSSDWPLGIFFEDFEYIENSGILDYYNGRFAVTPEYPAGTYAYYATMDNEGNSEFPYFIGLSFYGDLSPCHMGMGLPPGGGPPGGGPPGGMLPTCDQVPPGAPCCGDGICDGPETSGNCPADCGGLRPGPDVDCIVPADGSALSYAATGNLPTCNSMVNAGADATLDTTTGQATLIGSGDTGTGTTYNYNWFTQDGNIASDNNSNTISVDASGTYIFTVTDENGFSVYDRIIVTGNDDPTPPPIPQTGSFNCEDDVEAKEVVAIISPKNDSGMSGTITFTEVNGVVTMVAEVANVSPPGDHAIHIHAIGNCSADDGSSAGGHWNPTDEDHGIWGTPPFHRGDIGNILIAADGTGTITQETDLWCIGCDDPVKDILGKAIIIHAGPDDFSSQPSGAAGPRIGCAEIGDCVPIEWYQDADGDGLGNPAVSTAACNQPAGYVADNTDTDDTGGERLVLEVDEDLFITDEGNVTITTVPCMLSDGTTTECYEIVSRHIPTEHQMGPWCPENITDGPEAGGLWIHDGEVYDVDGPFIANLATFYDDPNWKMYEDDGTVRRMETQEDCEQGADPNIEDIYMNVCAQCLPEHVDVEVTYLIPITPVIQASSTQLGDGPTIDEPGVEYGPLVRGLAFNGVRYDHPADINIILAGYQIAPVDDAGGHINNRLGYHYHGDMGFTKKIEQADGHAPMIGYALDGHGIYAQFDANGNEATGLDECRGQYDDIRGYHYHVDGLGSNEFFDCFSGAWAVVDDIPPPPGGGMVLNCDDPQAGPRCCGDGICDGPETEENCPADCGEQTCEGTLDECGVCYGPGPATWYQDADGDGFGNPDVSLMDCEQPTGYVSNSDDMDDTTSDRTIVAVDESLFLTDATNLTITTVNCTLSNGTSTTCYQIVSKSVPADHNMGPWCPDNIADGPEAGGTWMEGGQLYDVDGAFIENMATFYNDDTWLMYDTNGDIYKTETLEDCMNAANPNVGDAYQNFCVECLPSYVADLSQTYLIPTTPVILDSPVNFGGMGPPGMGSGGPAVRGVAFNGVRYDAPAPTNVILAAYTLAPFDDAGGHINPNAGYHYHSANGLSTKVEQNDGHAAMIGYAMDGHAIYEYLDANGNPPTGLDECRGQYDDIRGYHYHVDVAGSNNFINCLQGAYAN